MRVFLGGTGVPVKCAAMTPRRVRPASLAFATLAMVGAGLASPTGVASATPTKVGATAKAVPQVEDCGMGKNLVEPKTFVLACADANSEAVSLVWTKWDSTTARAKGVYTWNLCDRTVRPARSGAGRRLTSASVTPCTRGKVGFSNSLRSISRVQTGTSTGLGRYPRSQSRAKGANAGKLARRDLEGSRFSGSEFIVNT